MFCAFEDNMLLDFLSLLLYPLSFPFIDSFIIDVQIISFCSFYVLNIKIWRFWLVVYRSVIGLKIELISLVENRIVMSPSFLIGCEMLLPAFFFKKIMGSSEV